MLSRLSRHGSASHCSLVSLLFHALLLAGATAAPEHLGDLDEDGVFTANDLARLVAHTAGTSPLSETLQPFADLTGDGVINDGDHAALVSLILETAAPQALPLASVRSTSPAAGEADVAVTRETVLHFSMPLALDAALDTEQFRAEFGGRRILSRVEISADRRRATLFYLEPLPSNARVRVTFAPVGLTDLLGRPVDPDGDGTGGGSHELSFDTLSVTAIAGTAVRGRVLASHKDAGGADVPLPGVTVTVDGAEETLRAVTDAQGDFVLSPCPAGSFFVHVDGRTSPLSHYPEGSYYPSVGKRWEAAAGRTDNLSGNRQDTARGVIYLPHIRAGSLTGVSQTEETEVDLPEETLEEFPEMQGTRLIVPPNSLFADDGTRGGRLGLAPVDSGRLPSPLPPGLQLPMVVTIQTDGASNFDTPVPVRFPNLPDPATGQKLPPGAKTALWSFNHDTGEWEVVGPMTVTEDGLFVQSDAGVGVRQPGWHGNRPGSGAGGPGDPGGPPGYPSSPSIGDPGTPPLPPCGPGFKDPQNLQEVQELIAFNATNAGMGIGGRLIKMLGDLPRGAKELFKFGKGARKEFQEMDQIVGDAHAYRQYLEALRDFYIEYADGQGPGRPQPPCQPAAASAAPLRPAALQAAALSLDPDIAELIIGYESLAAALKQQLQLEAQIGDILAGKPDNYVPNAAEAEQIRALEAQRNTLLGGQGAHQRYEPMWAQLRQKLAAVTRGTVFSQRRPAESAFFALVREDDGTVVQRGRTSPAGALPNLILTPDTDFLLRVFYPSTRAVAETSFNSGPTGSQSTLLYPGLPATRGGSVDTDDDGLSNLAELVIGTSAALADTDGDLIADGMEIAQGTDPLSGLAASTGILASVPTAAPATDVAAVNNLVVTANGTAGISLFDVAGGLNPVRVADLDTPGTAVAVALTGSTVAVADAETGLTLVDAANRNAVRVRARINPGSAVGAVTSAGPMICAGTADGRILLVDPDAGTVLARLSLAESLPVQDLTVWRDTLYALQVGRLSAIRMPALTLESTLPLAGGLGAGGRRLRLFAAEGTLYATHTQGFNILDIRSDPDHPALVRDFTTGQFGWKQIVANGSGLGLAATSANSTDDGDHPVDLYQLGENEREPVFATTFPTAGIAAALSIYNGLAYVAASAGGLQVLSYLPFDTQGQPPTIGLSASIPLHPTEFTGTAESGKLLRLSAAVSDDVQVRNVEFHVDGVLALVDGNYPFEYRFTTPKATLSRTHFTVRAKATDTGGNISWTPAYTIALVPDTTPPAVTRAAPQGLIGKVTTLLAYMNEALQPASVTPASFLLRQAGPDNLFETTDDAFITPQSVAYRDDLQAAAMVLSEELPPGLYRAQLTTDLLDLSGNALAAPHTWELNVDNDPVYWTGGASGNWGDAGSWSTGEVPGQGAVVVINAPPGVEVNLSGQSVQAKSINVIGGASLVVDPGEDIYQQTTYLYGVTLYSDLIVRNGGYLYVAGGLTLANANLVLDASERAVYFQAGGQQTLGGNGTIEARGGQAGVALYDHGGLTLGSGITLQVQGNVYSYGGNYALEPTVNEGRIITADASADLYLANWLNRGSIAASAGKVILGYGWKNEGVLEVAGSGRLELAGWPLRTADIGTLQRDGGTVRLDGTLDNRDRTLALNAATGSWETSMNFRLEGGALTTAGGARLIVPANQQATLDDVHLQGAVQVAAGGELTLEGDWINDGSIQAAGGTVRLGGTFTVDDLGTVDTTGGSLEVVGVLDNTGRTLLLDAMPLGLRIGYSGTVRGGRISGTGGSITMPAFAFWQFDGVTLNRDLKLENGVTLNLHNGFTLDGGDLLAGGSTEEDYGAGANLYCHGTQTLGGSGELQFDGFNGRRRLNLQVFWSTAEDGQPEPGELTIGAGITVRYGEWGELGGYQNQKVVNQGTVRADTAASRITISGRFTNAATGVVAATGGAVYLMGGYETSWDNAGTFTLNGTGSFNLGSTFTLADLGTLQRSGGAVRIVGTLDNTGGVLALNAATGSWELGAKDGGTVREGRILGGRITTTGGAPLLLAAEGAGILEDATLEGHLVAGAGTLDLVGDWVNNGSITATGTAINLGGEFRASELGIITRNGGSLNITGTLDNTGSSLVLDLPDGLRIGYQGTVRGGTLTTQSGGAFTLPAYAWWKLDGVTLDADLIAPSSGLSVRNGLQLNSRRITLQGSILDFQGTQTLAGPGEVLFNADVFHQDYLQLQHQPNLEPAAVLTIAPNVIISIRGNGAFHGYYTDDSIVNQGLIRADTAGMTLHIYLPFTNQGTLQQTNGGSIVLH